uniref:TSA: Wollemia nobilis Ref_Wollemi_Transcript_9867_2934 transcribed RNA sequence n=1 Tax=Wollemia nobilis TaxID=56998 RepID=A0A0C9RW21_9CONI
MCGGPEHSKQDIKAVDFEDHGKFTPLEKQPSKVKDSGICFSILLELAANNDLIGFKQAVEEDGSAIDEISFWYGRKSGSKQMGLEQRTPLMIAALYGSIDVLQYILSAYATCGIDVNLESGSGKSTALHCAAAGGSSFAREAVELLLQSGADVNRLDANGKRPVDVIVVSPKLSNGKAILEIMLSAGCHVGASSLMKVLPKVSDNGFSYAVSESYNDLRGGPNRLGSPPLSSSPEALGSKFLSASSKFPEALRNSVDGNEKKEYPVDPSLPDIKNSMYSTDDFRMYSFKVKPCSRAYSHDWTECPFVHPGENARRRDPRRYHYSCVPCPEFRKGSCRRADACEYAHGVFECWLHPAQYRTRLCKDETKCTRRVCFFAHRPEELRPLSVYMGSSVPSPRASSSLDMNSTMSPIMLGSPSSMFMMSAVSPSNPSQGGLATPPMSPSSSSASSLSGAWQQPNVPTLHLPGGSLQGSLQASRLRASLSARDMPIEELSRGSDYEGQLVGAAVGNTSFRSAKYKSYGSNTVAPTNLEDLFASEILSPRAPGLEASVLSHLGSQIQSQKAVQGHSQLQSQMQMQTSVSNQMSQMQMQQGSMAAHSASHLHPQQSSYSLASLSRMSSLGVDLERQNSNGAAFSPSTMASAISRSAAFMQKDIRSHSSRDLSMSVPSATVADWGSPTGKVDWGIQGEELRKFRKSVSFGYRSSDEPDLSWVQTLVKETPGDALKGSTGGSPLEAWKTRKTSNIDKAVLSAWMEQMYLDQQTVA